MHPLIQEIPWSRRPEALANACRREPGLILLRSALFESSRARYSFLALRPFLQFRSFGARCELTSRYDSHVQFGNPWQVLSALVSRYELLDEPDFPFPLGGCFGYWGYDLKQFTEPKLSRRALNDIEFPDCQVGFYDSLVAFDHRLGKSWIISTGLDEDGSRDDARARRQSEWWQKRLLNTSACEENPPVNTWSPKLAEAVSHPPHDSSRGRQRQMSQTSSQRASRFFSNLPRKEFLERVDRAQAFIRAGDIYQVNLSQRLTTPLSWSAWELFQRLSAISPAPFSAYFDGGDFQIVSSSPELFLRLSGAQVQTRPIKGTRPRSADPIRDAQLAYELQTSAKETAELVMITDLLRNDLGRCCEYGSVQTPDLLRLERFPQVQHLVSTVEGRLRTGVGHLEALASCFPGGSVTGAPKFRALEIIDELEPTTRGPYTGALGYIGFNRESQLSIIIRAALCKDRSVHFPVGAGIVADSDPEGEYEETLVKARGFLDALQISSESEPVVRPDSCCSGVL